MTEKERVIKDAIAIAKIPAPTGSEERRGKYIANEFKKLGLKSKISPVGNVIVRKGEGPAVAVLAHLDTVFTDQEITVTRDGDVLHGKGIVDNSLGLAGLLYLARKLKKNALPEPIILAATVGEEGVGNLKGARDLVLNENIKALIALEGSGIEYVAIGGPGSVRFKVEINGPGGHSWINKKEKSANEEMIRLLSPLVNKKNINIGILKGGKSPSAISKKATATIEARGKTRQRLKERKRLITKTLNHFKTNLAITVTPLGEREPGMAKAKVISMVKKEREGLGLQNNHEQMMSTDANPALASGIPATSIGLAAGTGLHSGREMVDLSDLDRGLLLLEGVIKRMGILL